MWPFGLLVLFLCRKERANVLWIRIALVISAQYRNRTIRVVNSWVSFCCNIANIHVLYLKV